MPSIYCADVWCDACTEAIKADCHDSKTSPAHPYDETTYDSDEFPKYMPDDSESDTPQHCGSGADCLEAEVLSDGSKIGALLSTTLTDDGIDYVREAVADGGNVAEFWAIAFADYLS